MEGPYGLGDCYKEGSLCQIDITRIYPGLERKRRVNIVILEYVFGVLK